MRRDLFNLLTLLSLLLCVAAAVLWVRSYAGGDQFQRLGPTRSVEIVSRGGRIGFESLVGGDRPWRPVVRRAPTLRILRPTDGEKADYHRASATDAALKVSSYCIAAATP